MANPDVVVSETAQAAPQQAPQHRSGTVYRVRFWTSATIINIVLVLLVALTVIPFLYMVLSAFKPNAEIFGTPITFFPVHFTWDNMVTLLTQFAFPRWMLNTAIVAVVGTLGSVLLSSLAGFAFAKYNFRFKNALFLLTLATLLIPSQVMLVPQFEIIRVLHWFNTYQALIIPRLVTAFGIFLMRQYTLSVSDELLDAARVDGATEVSIWWHIVVPLVRPGLAVLAILSFTNLWNDFFWPLIVTTDPSMFVVNLGLSSLVGPYDFQYGILLSGSVLASLPLVIMFLIFQRQFIQGFSEGSFK
jgi:multiple sugar transport system permease protein/arabinosaccharide transport system permease protein